MAYFDVDFFYSTIELYHVGQALQSCAEPRCSFPHLCSLDLIQLVSVVFCKVVRAEPAER